MPKSKKHSSDRSVKTIFYQGNSSSQTHMSVYKPDFIASTGERVQCSKGVDIINDPFVGPEIHDVNLDPFQRWTDYLKPTNWWFTARSYFIHHYTGTSVTPSINGTHSDTVKYYSNDYSKFSYGQDLDIQSHKNKVDACQETYPEDDLVLFGVSRGAATTFNALSKHKYQNVKLVILEGCFYSLNDVLSRMIHSSVAPYLEKALAYFTAYRPQGPSPSSNIDDFPKEVPVVFISSLKDRTVHYEGTKKLAQELRERGHPDVYLLTLEKADHPRYVLKDKEDTQNYERFIHAVYKHYGLPHDAELAQKGQTLLEKSRIGFESKQKPASNLVVLHEQKTLTPQFESTLVPSSSKTEEPTPDSLLQRRLKHS